MLVCLTVSLEAASHVLCAMETGLDFGVFDVVHHVLCDWGITPVNSDDHIRVCISESSGGLTEWEGQLENIND
jgi:hypothetical protein